MFFRILERLLDLLALLFATALVVLDFRTDDFVFGKLARCFDGFRFLVCVEVLDFATDSFDLDVCFFLGFLLLALRLDVYLVVERHLVVVTDLEGSFALKTAKLAPLAEPPSWNIGTSFAGK